MFRISYRKSNNRIKAKRWPHWGLLWALQIYAIISIVLYSACTRIRPVDYKLNVVLITIDTLRADHLHCYGYNKIQTPHLDSLAEQGYLFEQAYTSSPVTAPSHATILTGTYQIFHGVRDNGNYILKRKNLTLAEILKKIGYNTGAFVSSFVLERRFGLYQGFDTYNNDFKGGFSRWRKNVHHWMGHKFDNFERNAELTNRHVFPWIKKHKDSLFFLWVHYYDPHKNYNPPEPWASKYKGRPYDGEIAFVDNEIGRLLDQLRKIGTMEKTLLVVVADHGEGLGQHEKTHGLTLFDPLIRVPLIIIPPGGVSPGRRVHRLVQTVDILPTILDFLGMEIPEVVQGHSFRVLMEKHDDKFSGDVSPVYADTHCYERPYRGGILRGIRTSHWKYVAKERDSLRQLYDLVEDPAEIHNVIDQHPQVAGELQTVMNKIVEKHSPDGKENEQQIKMNKKTEEKLRALGYIK